MTPLKTATMTVALIVGATSLAVAQNGMPPASYKGPGGMPDYPANTAANAAASGGGGTHQSSQKTGSAANTQKVLGNQNGYASGSNGMPPASYKGPGGMTSYPVAEGTGAQKTGSAENTQRVVHNRNDSRGARRYSYNRRKERLYR